jgi:hypothetical protein
MRKIDVYFYGLFMDQDLLREKGFLETNLRPASLPGFKLHIGKRATLVPSQDAKVFGLIGSLSHTELAKLYSESSVQDYRPEAVLAYLPNGEPLAALCFNLVEPPSSDEHNPDYATKLRALAKHLKFPSDYIASI